VTLILSADRSRHRSSTRRLGTACGVAVGGLLYLPQLLQTLDPTRRASGGADLFGDGPALLIPLFLGICRRLDRALGFGGDPHLPVGDSDRRHRVHRRADCSVSHLASNP